METAIQEKLAPLRFNDNERAYFQTKLASLKTDWANRQEEERSALALKLGQIRDRINRLTDAFLDGVLDRTLFDQRKTALLMDQKGIEENMANLRDPSRASPDAVQEFLELAGDAWLSYEVGILEEKRAFLKIVTSNREVDAKNVVVKLSFPFCEVANRVDVPAGDPNRDIPRTWDKLLGILTTASANGQLPDLSGLSDFRHRGDATNLGIDGHSDCMPAAKE